ncbi:hypothetical protein KEM52_005293 [Ascosphaera acerosa]|nr:hypothetical protein KEM52_005293 [Ascosphaera acerosa]
MTSFLGFLWTSLESTPEVQQLIYAFKAARTAHQALNAGRAIDDNESDDESDADDSQLPIDPDADEARRRLLELSTRFLSLLIGTLKNYIYLEAGKWGSSLRQPGLVLLP